MKRLLVSAVAGLAVAALACSSSSPTGTGAGAGDGGALEDGGATTPGTDGGVATGGDASKPPTGLGVTATDETIDVYGTSRKYTLAVPKSYDASRKYPLVLVFHGDGGDGKGMRAYSKFDDTTGDDAIVAYPTGSYPAPDTAWDLDTPTANNADMQFIKVLIDGLAGKYSVDTSRVFLSGYSRGGFFVNKFACRHPAGVRGISSNSGGAPYDDGNPHDQYPNYYYKCDAGEVGVATFVVHGDADGEVPVDSGDFDAQYWAYVNGCTGDRVATSPSPCVKYDGCPADKQVDYCLVPGLGHEVWSEGNKASWAFFQAIP